MEIRRKLTYQFSATVAVLLFLSFMAIYFSFSESRKAEFIDRLKSKAKLVGQMLIDIEEIDVELLRKIEQNNPLNLSNEKVIIYDDWNRQLFVNFADTSISITTYFMNQVRARGEWRYVQHPYEIYGLQYSGPRGRIFVFVAATDIFGRKKLTMLGNILLLVFVVSMAFVFIAGRFFANQALNPIEGIIARVDEIGISNLDARVEEGNGKDEIAKLAITFNNMLHRLDSSFRIQKTFIANASHELRNPLTAITGQLEVMLMTSRSAEEYRNTLKSVHEDIVSINQMANNLLLLAQTSLDSASHNFVRIRIDDILWHTVNEMKVKHPDYQVNINFSANIDDEENLTIMGNEQLMRIVFINLLENAYKYSDKKKVSILVDQQSDQISIGFTDEGYGIAGNEISLIFNPFYRSKQVVHRKGHGIGLSLVENIVTLHQGYVTVNSVVNKGSTFTIHLPVHQSPGLLTNEVV